MSPREPDEPDDWVLRAADLLERLRERRLDQMLLAAFGVSFSAPAWWAMAGAPRFWKWL